MPQENVIPNRNAIPETDSRVLGIRSFGAWTLLTGRVSRGSNVTGGGTGGVGRLSGKRSAILCAVEGVGLDTSSGVFCPYVMRTALFPRALAQFAWCRQPGSSRYAFTATRALSTTAHGADASNTRNIALLAHIDSGKTTLTESILLASGYLSGSGTVDTGSTVTDFLPAERERGITIQSASVPVKWKGWSYNLVDTPGHADFGMEVESASRIIDGAVVLMDSVEGVESQTLGVWSQLNRYEAVYLTVFDRLNDILLDIKCPPESFSSTNSTVLAPH